MKAQHSVSHPIHRTTRINVCFGISNWVNRDGNKLARLWFKCPLVAPPAAFSLLCQELTINAYALFPG